MGYSLFIRAGVGVKKCHSISLTNVKKGYTGETSVLRYRLKLAVYEGKIISVILIM